MAKERTPDRWRAPAEPPSDVQITVLWDRDGRALRERIVAAPLVTRALAVIVLVIAAIIAGALLGERNGAPRGARARPRGGGPAGVAAAYGYPLRCLSVTISAIDRAYVRADFDRDSRCGRYDGYATAIFHRVDGAWRPVLNAIGYSCPVASVPRAVQAELGVCAQTDGRRAASRRASTRPH